jgi:O-antigen/teichoic acid export membrane protein
MEELPNQIVFNAVNRVMFPLLSKVQDDNHQMKRVYSQIIKVVSFIVIPFLTLLYLTAEPLFIFLLTEKWLPAVQYFKILILAGMIEPLQPYLLNICKVKGRSDLVLKLSVVEYFFVFLSLLAIIPFGIIGLLWGLVIATLAKLLVAMFYSGRLIGYTIKNQLMDLKEGILISIIAFISIFLIEQAGLLNNFVPFVELLLISISFYIVVLSISFLLKFESVQLIRSLLVRNKN